MAQDDDFSSHDFPHVRIERFQQSAQYVFPATARDAPELKKDPVEHSALLAQQLTAALGAIPGPNVDQRVAIPGHVLGTNVKIETTAPDSDRKGPARTPNLDFAAQNIRVLQSSRNDDRSETSVVFVPDQARQFLLGRVQAYGRPNIGNQKRPDIDRFEPIDAVRPAPAHILFLGPIDFADQTPFWWEVWISPKTHAPAVCAAARNAEILVHDERQNFPEMSVAYMRSSAGALATFLGRVPGLVPEVRKATGNITPFLDLGGLTSQHDWVDELAGRIVVPDVAFPTVCVLDSGINAAHPLIQPGLAGAWTVDEGWGTDDHHPHGGHGTPMAGAVLHGDLFFPMYGSSQAVLTHTVESVKFLPPTGFPPTEPPTYGTITQAAVAIAEIARPEAVRSFCMAVSTAEFPPSGPSTWSGAIDQIASGAMPGDLQNGVDAKDLPKRLFMVATGNRAGGTKAEVLAHQSLEDPAQSWNALTIGGYTAKDVGPADDPSLLPLAVAYDKSPFSCGSQTLPTDLTPIKPEVLFEAGNMVVYPPDHCDWHEAVSLLATGSDVVNEPLVPFWATSAATAIAGNFIGQLKSALPGLWPETYRALIVQSAEWPQPIRAKFIGTGAHWKAGNKAAKQMMLRDVGYGVPNLLRAVASAKSDVTLMAQAEIKPYTMGQGSAVFNEMHFYALPWPRQVLQDMGNAIVSMKVTLSYFPEPNLTGRAATRPDTYRSYGLRFALKKRAETPEQFHGRLSVYQDENADGEAGAVNEPSYWLLGPKAVQAGSLHADLWRGHAVDLALHDHLAVYPVGGWWKSHLGQQRYEDRGRYALIVSITAEGGDVDLYSEITAEVEAAVAAEISAETT
ncbi:S8 family peptidase [Paradevosia shaoguanensis]|uniref:S8 family peptidase n=1 Tax=Paradevosia shaoguanensis TaxID=1335043 RepID=A0AA41QJZ5_9HYPH|nr:S8 family peptidase [Paradevosia shaoguanensis]MCF1741462.1 S8 family peptidase [Paradevosia shaoguanensis]MCI0125945.1 S8 family peptidase [Paradevosia shaoguanensis]